MVSTNLHHPGCLQVKMRKLKNIRSERDMPTQIYFGSMDPLVCPILNVAIQIEMFFPATTQQSVQFLARARKVVFLTTSTS